MTSTLESEDLDTGPLVRMEDVQPARTRICDVSSPKEVKTEPIESYIVDHLDYENECVVDDDDSNIGSMVSIRSEDVGECDDNSNDAELIVPEAQPAATHKSVKLEVIPKIEIKSSPDSWPTLEILPGGVIKHSDKCDEDLSTIYPNEDNETENDSGEMMYACAKCSMRFKHLFCLVKHVRWHEKEQKKQVESDLTKLTTVEQELLHVKKESLDLEKCYKRQKVEVLARIATAVAEIGNIEDIFE